MAVCEARRIKKIKVFSPTRANLEKFARETRETVGIDIVPVDSYQEAVRGVDIIITATNSRTPFLGKWAAREGLHLSSMQRDEFDDEALRCCTPLVLHTQLTENNSTSSELAQYEREDFKLRDHPTTRGIDWKSADPIRSSLRPHQRPRERRADHRVRQQHRPRCAICSRRRQGLCRGEGEGSWPGGAAGLVHSGRASLTGVRNAFAVS